MVQPNTLVLALALLLLGTAARAQRAPRERRERTVTVTGNLDEPPHEVRAAKGVATLLLFKSRINGGSVELDRMRVKIIDVGEWSIIFEPVIDLGTAERLVLSVPFADGQRAVFVLVSHASEVDTRIDVIRREQTVEACQAELAEAQARCSKISPVHFARAGWLTPSGVTTRRVFGCHETTPVAGLVCMAGTAYRAESWALVDVKISNASDQPPWGLRETVLKDMKSGVRVTVRAVEMDAAQIGPGEVRHVFVEVDPLATNVDGPFTLELKDAERSITIGGVDLRKQESQR